MGGIGNAWVIRDRPRPSARLRLFCFPYAGGGASAYRTWPDRLPTVIEVCAIQPPGREARIRETPIDRLPVLIDALAAALVPHLDRPFAFFGHSMGALICFSLARQFRRDGRTQPAHLLVSGRRAPQIPASGASIHQLPDQRFVAELSALGGTSDGVIGHRELLALMLPTLRADFAVVETYSYEHEPPLRCPITAFGGRDDGSVGEESLRAWRQQSTGRFVAHTLPGDHFFIRSAEKQLVEHVTHELAWLLP